RTAIGLSKRGIRARSAFARADHGSEKRRRDFENRAKAEAGEIHAQRRASPLACVGGTRCPQRVAILGGTAAILHRLRRSRSTLSTFATHAKNVSCRKRKQKRQAQNSTQSSARMKRK